MSFSEPKPKVIYQTLEELIRGSSLTKNNSSRCSASIKKNSERILTELSANCMAKSNSKHRLESKDKICYTETSNEKRFIKSGKVLRKSTDVGETYYQQIENIYNEMELLLGQSKEMVLQNLRRSVEGGDDTRQNVKQLYKISGSLRKMFSNLINQGQQISVQNNEMTVPFETNEGKVQSMERLSKMNQKKRVNGRLKNMEVTRAPSIYEQVLKKKK